MLGATGSKDDKAVRLVYYLTTVDMWLSTAEGHFFNNIAVSQSASLLAVSI